MSSHVPKTRAGWYSKKYISQYFDNIYTVYIAIFTLPLKKFLNVIFCPPWKDMIWIEQLLLKSTLHNFP